MAAANASVLPPPPAQISSTCCRGPAPAISAAICEPSSCTSYQPLPCAASALDIGLPARPFRRRKANAQRRKRRRDGREPRQRLQHLLAVGLERVDPQIDRRSARQAPPLPPRPPRRTLGATRAPANRGNPQGSGQGCRRAAPVTIRLARPRSADPRHTPSRRHAAITAAADRPSARGAAASTMARAVSLAICAASERFRRKAS